MNAADVIVVGGGIMGTSAAFFLRRQGKSVILLERGLI
ncbi:MAG: FAD-binding oxidoreductase, partial [Gammaproteobacteria bacterium]